MNRYNKKVMTLVRLTDGRIVLRQAIVLDEGDPQSAQRVNGCSAEAQERQTAEGPKNRSNRLGLCGVPIWIMGYPEGPKRLNQYL